MFILWSAINFERKVFFMGFSQKFIGLAAGTALAVSTSSVAAAQDAPKTVIASPNTVDLQSQTRNHANINRAANAEPPVYAHDAKIVFDVLWSEEDTAALDSACRSEDEEACEANSMRYTGTVQKAFQIVRENREACTVRTAGISAPGAVNVSFSEKLDAGCLRGMAAVYKDAAAEEQRICGPAGDVLAVSARSEAGICRWPNSSVPALKQ